MYYFITFAIIQLHPMKIRKIHIQEYKIFKDFEIDLTSNGEPLNIIVVAGINGSGKTTLFDFTYNFIEKEKYLEDKFNYIECEALNVETNEIEFIEFRRYPEFEVEYDLDSKVFIPSYLNAVKYIKAYQNDTKNSKNVIIRYIDKLIYEEDLKSSQAYARVQKILNKIFEGFDLQVEFETLDKYRNVYFKSNTSKKIGLDDLSTGEKELITKAFSLYLANINNSLILIDEPESSLHPNWQNRILKIYEDFAKENNNQIIIATHSPHIIASAKKESLRLLVKRGDKIEVVSDFDGSYGYEVQRVLLEIMNLESLRIPGINEKIELLFDFVHKNQYNSNKFLNLQNELEELLGRNDKDLMMLRLEIARRKKENEKNK